MQAWFSGDFERCLERCDAVDARDALTASQVRLLRSRALLRLGRADDALRELGDATVLHPTPDVVATALMLQATAHVRLGDYALGLALLDDARAVRGDVHPTIRSEIALTAGLAFYGMRALDQAREQLDAVAPDTDIVYARALEYRGWIETVRADFDRASRYFDEALAQLDTCRHYDRYLEANALMALGLIAVERLDVATWERLAARVRAFDWSAPGLARPRYCMALFASVFCECAGDLRGAMRAALDAELFAHGDAQKAQAALRRAEIARGSGEGTVHVGFVDQAEVLFARVPGGERTGDALYVPLTLAEEFALFGDRAKAEASLALYRAIERPLGMLAVGADVRRAGFERMAEAHVFAVQGDEASALRAFLDAFEIFERIGFTRRATVAALRLAELTRSERYRRYALAATEHLAATFWLRRAAVGDERGAVDPAAERLTARERETLVLICQGRTNKQIAAAQGRSFYTVRNMVAELLALFGVENRRQLVAACRRLGVDGDPGRPTR